MILWSKNVIYYKKIDELSICSFFLYQTISEKCINVTMNAKINVPTVPIDIYPSISKNPIIKKEKKYTGSERHSSSFTM